MKGLVPFHCPAEDADCKTGDDNHNEPECAATNGDIANNSAIGHFTWSSGGQKDRWQPNQAIGFFAGGSRIKLHGKGGETGEGEEVKQCRGKGGGDGERYAKVDIVN